MFGMHGGTHGVPAKGMLPVKESKLFHYLVTKYLPADIEQDAFPHLLNI